MWRIVKQRGGALRGAICAGVSKLSAGGCDMLCFGCAWVLQYATVLARRGTLYRPVFEVTRRYYVTVTGCTDVRNIECCSHKS